MNTYWGDIHTHTFCGGGFWRSIEEAAVTARQHLDFWAPTEHHDDPNFDWDRICRTTREADDPGKFVALLAQEVGTGVEGDFNVYYPQEGAPEYRGMDLHEAFKIVRAHGGIAIPHHTGYKVGTFGTHWEKYFHPDIAPLAEIFSMHGSSERDNGPWPLELGMGPRETIGCALSALNRGHRFGFVAGTDGHNGYPGTYGMGLTGIKASELTRSGVFDALKNRRTWGVTGDRIDVKHFSAGAAGLGESVRAGNVDMGFDIEGLDLLDTVDVVKNGKVVRRFSAWEQPDNNSGPYACRIGWGWGKRGETIEWSGKVEVKDGAFARIVPVFGAPAPDTYEVHGNTVTFNSVTNGYNGDWATHRHRIGGDCGFCLVIEGDAATQLRVEINGIKASRALGELMQASEVHCLPVAEGAWPWNASKVKIYPALPANRFRMQQAWTEPMKSGDFLYIRVRQDNNQMAWLSPVFAE